MGKQTLLLLSLAPYAAARASFLGDIRPLLHSSVEKRDIIDQINMYLSLGTGIMAMEIVWACLLAILLVAILFNLRRLRPASAQAPYILLAVGTMCSIVSYGVNAGMGHDLSGSVTSQYLVLSSTGSFFYGFGEVSLLASVVWVIQQRSEILANLKGSTAYPVTSQNWKRSLDWILVLLVFAFEVIYHGLNARLNAMFLDPSDSVRNDWTAGIKTRSILFHVLVAFSGLLVLNIVVSLVLLFRSGRRERFGDKTVKWLLFVVAPFAVLYLASDVAFDVFYSTWSPSTLDALFVIYATDLTGVVVNGTFQFAMTLGLVLSMTASAVGEYSGQHGTDSSKGLVQYLQSGDEPKEPKHTQRV